MVHVDLCSIPSHWIHNSRLRRISNDLPLFTLNRLNLLLFNLFFQDLIHFLDPALKQCQYRPMVRESVLTTAVVPQFTVIRLVQNTVGPRRHSHLLRSVIDITLFIVLKCWLEIKEAFFKP